MKLLKIDDLDKLKFTSIKNVIHFKYDGQDYFIHENRDYTSTIALYKGRSKFKNECIKSEYGFCINLIRYKNNKKVLSAIDKENFVRKLYAKGLIDTNDKIKAEVKEKQEKLEELNQIIRKAQEEIRKINWEE